MSLRYLREGKFKHIFQDYLNLICSCGLDIESTSHFLLHCPIFNDERYTLRSALNNTDCKLPELTNSPLSKLYYMATNYLIKKKKTHLFLTQLLNLFYPLKDLKSHLLSKFSLQSLTLPQSFFYVLLFYFLPYSLRFLYVTFNIIF